MYIFKAYTNGHPYDTSQVWVQTFTEMLQGPASLVPAIIVPKTFPNQKTWDLLLRRYMYLAIARILQTSIFFSSIETELTGSMLTCQYDFSPEWRTYYDHRYNLAINRCTNKFAFIWRALTVSRLICAYLLCCWASLTNFLSHILCGCISCFFCYVTLDQRRFAVVWI